LSIENLPSVLSVVSTSWSLVETGLISRPLGRQPVQRIAVVSRIQRFFRMFIEVVPLGSISFRDESLDEF
jgi:hypothetical protein